ncbi:MAG TPA: UDP-galactopyranose mutase [Azonexus sp.]|nr:UDP-galactopyranose mutase [Azonexus sp.]
MSPPGECAGICDAIICFSHLRWNFVFQRPHHLLTRLARSFPVFFFEEPVHPAEGETPRLDISQHDGVTVIVPRLPASISTGGAGDAQRVLLDCFIAEQGILRPLLWYYTPMSLGFSDHLGAVATIYDCMDELSCFMGASPMLPQMEQRLLARADVLFTGGHSLYQAKRGLHANVHAVPSSVDVAHFRAARDIVEEPADQAAIPHPRLGFYGVIDERLDIALLGELSLLRPDWQIVLIGPVAKIDPARLPRQPNIHYLGPKSYDELPGYVAGWDVAIMPFALNEATRYISPTKTPEFLAAGRPVVSSAIVDVVEDYGKRGLVAIAEGAAGFAEEIGKILGRVEREDWLGEVDAALADLSWDVTCERMMAQIEKVAQAREGAIAVPPRPRRWAPLPRGFDYLIVGAGFAGAVLAERLAVGSGKRVLLIDRRPHIGGNAYDAYDDAGILVHRYGPHIFHTNSERIFNYLSRFTAWRPYEHRVLAYVDGHMVPIPINLTTINELYGLDLTPEGMEAFLAERSEPPETIRTSRDVVLAAVGSDLYQKFFEGYTRKQWGVDPSMLDKSVTARIPTRTNTDDRYFGDQFQAMPRHGYTRMFENMLDHRNIKVMLNTDYREVVEEIPHDRMIYTGPIDEFFNYRFGPLPYRSLQFRHVTLDRPSFQPRAVINYPSPKVPYTRITEYKHLTGQCHEKTSISFEFPCAEGDPYYPIPTPANAALYKRYQVLANTVPGVWFVGRLATYRYYNMDQVVGQALALYQQLSKMDGLIESSENDPSENLAAN